MPMHLQGYILVNDINLAGQVNILFSHITQKNAQARS